MLDDTVGQERLWVLFCGVIPVLVGGLGKSAVELEALAGVGDEVVGQEGGNVDRDFRIVLGANGLSAQLGDRLL